MRKRHAPNHELTARRSIETAHMAFIIVYIYIVTVKYYGLVFADGAFAWTAYVWPLAYSVTFANISAALVQVCSAQ